MVTALTSVISGYLFKWKTDLLGKRNVPRLSPDINCRNEEIVVSLTSFGRRVSQNVVYYTIISILKQTVKPNRIILWLDKDKWNENNIPLKLKFLITKGLEVKFCDENIKSFEKLVPTIKICPNSVIITVDDDLIYPNRMIEDLYIIHLKHPDAIVCRNSLNPIIKNKKLLPYRQWDNLQNKSFNGAYIFPQGFGGVLYPPNALHKDVINKDLFMKLCPYADDVWFWIMGLLNHTEKINIRNASLYGFDAFYQKMHKGAALADINVDENMNDFQIEKVLSYYKIQII